MNIEAKKISFIQDFLRIDDEKLINAVENFFYNAKSELFEDNLKPMSLEQFNSEIDEALEDEKNGNIIKSDELKKKIEKWR